MRMSAAPGATAAPAAPAAPAAAAAAPAPAPEFQTATDIAGFDSATADLHSGI